MEIKKVWLTVKVQGDCCITLAKFIFRCHFVFTGILNGNIFNLKCSKILLAIFINWQLKNSIFQFKKWFYAFLLYGITLWRASSLTGTSLWLHRTCGIGSALIKHSNIRRLPSSSWRIAGFFKNVGARPSICLYLMRVILIKKFTIKVLLKTHAF